MRRFRLHPTRPPAGHACGLPCAAAPAGPGPRRHHRGAAADLRLATVRPGALRSRALDRGRRGVHHAGAVRRDQGRLRHRALRLEDRGAERPHRGRGAGARRRLDAARHRQLQLVAGRQAADDLHQHEAGLAAEHPRRLLGARPRLRRAPAAGRRRRAGLHDDVRQVLAPGRPRRLRPEGRHLRRAAGRRRRSPGSPPAPTRCTSTA